jgi:hypothetical protein
MHIHTGENNLGIIPNYLRKRTSRGVQRGRKDTTDSTDDGWL